MSAPALIALDCPGCGRPLPGLEADVAFACAVCARAWELADGRFADRTFAQVAPAGRGDQGNGSYVNLPAWHMRAEVSVHVPEAADSELVARARRAIARAAEIHAGYALACSVPRTDVFGDWGHRWTGIQPEWTKAPSGLPVAGASLASADARVLVAHYAFDLLDRLVDVQAVKVSVKLGAPTLLGVPVPLDGDHLVSPWGKDLTLPVHALDGWFDIERQASVNKAG